MCPEGAGRGDVGQAQTAPPAPAQDMLTVPTRTLVGPPRHGPCWSYPSAQLNARMC